MNIDLDAGRGMKEKHRRIVAYLTFVFLFYCAAYGIARWRKLIVMQAFHQKEEQLFIRKTGPGCDIREDWKGRLKNKISPFVFGFFRPLEFVEDCFRGCKRKLPRSDSPNLQSRLWGPIDMRKWRETPCVSGRLATEKDVKEGRATFYVSGDPSDSRPLKIPLPACAVHHDTESGKATPVILIQAEETPKIKAVGYRFLRGGNGACTISELEILEEPDNRFTLDE